MELHNNIEKSVNDEIWKFVESENKTRMDESKGKMNLSDLVDDGENHQRLSNLVTYNYEQTDLC